MIIFVYPKATEVHRYIYKKNLWHYYRLWSSILHKVIESKEFLATLDKHDIDLGPGVGINDLYLPSIVLVWGNYSKRGYPSRETLDDIGGVVDRIIADTPEFNEFLSMFNKAVKAVNVNISKPVIEIDLGETYVVDVLAPERSSSIATSTPSYIEVSNSSTSTSPRTTATSTKSIYEDTLNYVLMTILVVVMAIAIPLVYCYKHR